MNGLLSEQMEQQLRSLIVLRNRIVHGDVSAQPTEQDVLLVLDSVEAALVPAAA
jgi:uncharacterized protein YutE (UPF0331/DUF86 family)